MNDRSLRRTLVLYEFYPSMMHNVQNAQVSDTTDDAICSIAGLKNNLLNKKDS